MPYTDDSGLIYDDEGKVIGATPRSYKTPEGTWNFYPNKRAVQQRAQEMQGSDMEQGATDELGFSSDDMMSGVADMFGFNSNSNRAKTRKRGASNDPFDFSGFF